MRLPKHIGVIPDGNRRWVKEHGFNKEDGYSYGLDCGLRFLRAASSRGIKEITYYGFTVDNCKRPKEQVEAFTKACCDTVQLIAKEDVALFVVGNTDSACFPKALLPFTKRREKQAKTLQELFFWSTTAGNGTSEADCYRATFPESTSLSASAVCAVFQDFCRCRPCIRIFASLNLSGRIFARSILTRRLPGTAVRTLR